MKKIKFIDLFSGLGGFRTAFETVAKLKKIESECVFVSEINENVIDTYIKNFNESSENIVNIRCIDDICSQVPDHDFLFAGFPCQTFSNAGNKKGFLDEIRGTLFFDIAKILKNKKPKYALLENVKHIINHDDGKTWKIIIQTLKDIGYILPDKPLILNPIDFGIPQDRKRVFIPMVLREKTKYSNLSEIKFDFKNFTNKTFCNNIEYKKTRQEIQKNFLHNNIKDTKKYWLENSSNGEYLIEVLSAWNEFMLNVKVDNKCLPVIWLDYMNTRITTDGMKKWKVNYLNSMWDLYENNEHFINSWMKKWNVHNWNKRERKFEWQAGMKIKNIKDTFIQLRQSGIRCRKPINFPTLVAMVQIPIIFDEKFKKWRYLSPRETANLQSFPQDYKLYNQIFPDKVNADFYSYMQIGNSVNVKVVSIIQEMLLNY